MSAQWFHDSVEAGYSMPEPDYDVDKEQGGESASGTSRKRYVNKGPVILLYYLHIPGTGSNTVPLSVEIAYCMIATASV